MHGRERPRIDPRSLASRPAFLLAQATIDPATRAVAGPSATVHLEPRVMQVLLALAEAGGQVVTRDELVERCWAGVPVGDDALNRTVAELRRAARETDAGFVVETIPRTGHRLRVEKETVEEPTPGSPDPPTAEPNSTRRRTIGVGLLGAAAVAGLVFLGRRTSHADPEVERLLREARKESRLAIPDAEKQGLARLQKASGLAPADARVWGALALAAKDAAEFASPDRTAALLSEAEDAANRALALDGHQPDALAARALLRPLHGNWGTIEPELLAVLRIAPDHLASLDALAHLQAGAGLLAAHYPLRLKTVALDPLHAGYNFRSIFAHWMNGQVAAADRAAARGRELWPHHIATVLAELSLYLGTGRPERALALLDDPAGRKLVPPPVAAANRATATALLSGGAADRARAVATIDETVARAGPFLAVSGAMNLAALGEPERAVQVWEAFLLARGPVMAGPAWKPGQPLHNDVRRRFTNHLFTPVMAPVRELPGFLRLCVEMGLADYWRASGHRPEFLGNRPLPT